MGAETSFLPIPTDWIVQGGATGLLGVVFLLIISGRLIPRSTYQSLERDRDHWREAALKAIGHAEELLPSAKITAEMVKAMVSQTTPQRTDLNSDPTSSATWNALGGAPANKRETT